MVVIEQVVGTAGACRRSNGTASASPMLGGRTPAAARFTTTGGCVRVEVVKAVAVLVRVSVPVDVIVAVVVVK